MSTATPTSRAALARPRSPLRAALHVLVVALVGGLLLFPATCAHAAGPHSVFLDPRVEVTATPGVAAHHHHHHHAPSRVVERALPVPECTGQERFSEFPDTMAMMATAAALAPTALLLPPALPVAPRIPARAAAPLLALFLAPDAPPPR